jgi:hypothetical protein
MQNSIFLLALLLGSSNLIADTIHPKGDENLGSLVIREPKWTTPAETNIFPYSTLTTFGTLKTGVATRMIEGLYRLQLKTTGFENIDYTDVAVAKKKTAEFLLGGLVATFETASRSTTATDIGPRANLRVSRNGHNLNLVQLSPVWSGSNERGMAVLPGTYLFSWGIPVLDPIEQEIRGAEVAHINLTPADKRVTVLVLPAALREFSGPPVPRCYAVANQVLLEHSIASGVLDSLVLPELTSKKELKAFPSSGVYRAVLNDIAEPFQVESGKTTEIALRRIDVDHVQITNERGQASFVTGSYQVERKQADGNWKMAAMRNNEIGGCAHSPNRTSFPTQTGLDVWRGEYRVTVQYSTAEGAKTDVHMLDLR